jgi:hypothetical protein
LLLCRLPVNFSLGKTLVAAALLFGGKRTLRVFFLSVDCRHGFTRKFRFWKKGTLSDIYFPFQFFFNLFVDSFRWEKGDQFSL